MASGDFNPKFTFTTQELQSIREVIAEDFFQKSDLNQFFTIVAPIMAKKKIGIVGDMTDVGRPKGACDTDSTNVTFPTIQKEWNPCSWGDRIPFCAADLEDQFWVWGLNAGVRRSDLTDTDFANFVSAQVQNAMLESLYKITFFGDVDAATVDASPAGKLTSGVDPELFQCHDGVWKQVFAIGTADAKRKVAISKNDGNSYANQTFNATDTSNKVVTGIFKDLIHKSHLKARAKTDRTILCTLSLADQYSNELESASGIPAAWEIQQNGIMSLKRLGVTIVAIPKWDDIIRTYFDDGVKHFRPHRALMINKSNMALGVDSESMLNEFDMYYDKVTKKNYVDFLGKIDTKIIQDIMVQAAY